MSVVRPCAYSKLFAFGLALTSACGGDPNTDPNGGSHGGASGNGQPAFSPGFFADSAALLEDTSGYTDNALAVEVFNQFYAPAALPSMTTERYKTLVGLIDLGYTGMLRTSDNLPVAIAIGLTILDLAVHLDPALGARATTVPGPGTLAQAGLYAIDTAAAGLTACVSGAPSLVPTYTVPIREETWVDEECVDERWVDGYCQSDTWVEGDCWTVWVPEQCFGGGWYDEGWWEWYCYSNDDCRYVWRPHWVYDDPWCDPGYYDEQCDPGYWEQGECYSGHWEEGYCTPGHYETRYIGGGWTFVPGVAPAPCGSVRSDQIPIAVTSAVVLHNYGAEFLPGDWGAALQQLFEQAPLGNPDESSFQAILQILEGTAP